MGTLLPCAYHNLRAWVVHAVHACFVLLRVRKRDGDK
jgi:hypothetical protein